jgi:hypothetical protein
MAAGVVSCWPACMGLDGGRGLILGCPPCLCVQVVVQPAATGCDDIQADSTGSSSISRPPRVAFLPQPMPVHTHAAAGACLQRSRICTATRNAEGLQPQQQQQDAAQLQLLLPQPGALLEADRPQQFRVLAPAGHRVVVGSPEPGWIPLQPRPASNVGDAAAGGGCGSGATASRADAAGGGLVVHAGSMVLPRVPTCYVAVQEIADQGQQQLATQAEDASAGLQAGQLLPMLGLHVAPPVSWAAVRGKSMR